jgi:hypothetical protein
MNLVDGQRDAAAITRFVAAETAAAGRWYYGEVTPASSMTISRTARSPSSTCLLRRFLIAP